MGAYGSHRVPHDFFALAGGNPRELHGSPPAGVDGWRHGAACRTIDPELFFRSLPSARWSR
jgi:hypothetical protein